MVLGDLFSVLQFKRYPFSRDSRLVVVTRDSRSSWSTTCFVIPFVVEFVCVLPVPVAQRIERLPSKQRVVGSNPSRDAFSFGL